MLRVIFAKKTLWITLKKFQFFESVKKGFTLLSRIQQRSSILRVLSEKRSSILCVISEKRVQFFESYQKKEFNSFSNFLVKKFNSVSQIQKKKFNSVSQSQKINSVSHIFIKKKKHFLESYLKKGPILFVLFEQTVQFFASYSSNLTVQSIASYSRNKGFNSLVIFKEKGFNSVSRTEKFNS